jgi:hypothetical protein
VATVILGVLLFLLALRSSGVTSALFTQGRSIALQEAMQGANQYYWLGCWTWVPAVLLLAAVARRTGSRIARVGAFVAFALVLARSIPTGERMILTLLLGASGAFYYLVREARPPLKIVCPLIAVGIIVSATFAEYRYVEVRKQSFATSMAQNFAHPVRALQYTALGEDSAEAAGFGSALYVVPSEIPFSHGGAVVGDLLTRWIPRTLWPSKPLPPRERVIQTLWTAQYEAHIANPEMSILLPFYMDWGMSGVIVGMTLTGVVLRLLYEYFLRFKAVLSAQILYALSIPMIIIGLRDGPVDTLVRASFAILPAAVVLVLAAGRQPYANQLRGTASSVAARVFRA